jgi:hypothetical protein
MIIRSNEEEHLQRSRQDSSHCLTLDSREGRTKQHKRSSSLSITLVEREIHVILEDFEDETFSKDSMKGSQL